MIHRHVRALDLNILMSHFEIHDGNNERQLSFWLVGRKDYTHEENQSVSTILNRTCMVLAWVYNRFLHSFYFRVDSSLNRYSVAHKTWLRISDYYKVRVYKEGNVTL